MRRIITLLVFFSGPAAVLLPASASAGDEWQIRITPYLWFAGVKGDVSTIPGAPVAPIDVSPSQALEDTEASFMGAFEVRKGRHGGFLDILYTDVESETTLIPAPINLTLKTTSKNTLLSAAYAYELYDRDQASVDIFGGVRYWEVETQLDFGGGLGLLAGRTISSNEDWIDPLIGINARSALGGSKFFVAGIVGVGGFGVGSDEFHDVSGHIGYQWNKTIGTTLGYRMYDVKYENGDFLYDVRQEGWLVGVSFAL